MIFLLHVEWPEMPPYKLLLTYYVWRVVWRRVVASCGLATFFITFTKVFFKFLWRFQRFLTFKKIFIWTFFTSMLWCRAGVCWQILRHGDRSQSVESVASADEDRRRGTVCPAGSQRQCDTFADSLPGRCWWPSAPAPWTSLKAAGPSALARRQTTSLPGRQTTDVRFAISQQYDSGPS